jgi:hypothetical protein
MRWKAGGVGGCGNGFCGDFEGELVVMEGEAATYLPSWALAVCSLDG